MRRRRGLAVTFGALTFALGCPVVAATNDALDLAAIRAELSALRATQDATAARIAKLETTLSGMQVSPPAGVVTRGLGPAVPSFVTENPSPKLTMSGDMRLRYESNFSGTSFPTRNRGALRGRLRGAFAISNRLKVGAELVTGDPEDPNSSDATLSNFDDDLQVSLDQLYVSAKFGELQVTGGKIPLPFQRTDLVWDGDVYPEGVSAIWQRTLSPRTTVKAAALYFVVDEAAAGPDSNMVGGQVSLSSALSPILKFDVSAGYYDYTLASLAGGDAGDFRSNQFVSGRYVSKFDLIDLTGTITFMGLGARWPARVAADYVTNQGAVQSKRDGYSVDLSFGRTTQTGDWRVTYGYSQAGIDAVFAAFSHDNTTLATNYNQHLASFDYVIAPHLNVNAVVYRYRPLEIAYANSQQNGEWLNRVRLNIIADF